MADGTLPPAAGRRTGLASRPGPQASTRTSPRQVKSAPPQAGTGLTPSPEPRVDTARCPSRRNKGTAPGTGRPWAGHREGGTVARAARARATVAPASSAGGQPGEGMPAFRQRAALSGGCVMGGAGPACRRFVRYFRNRVFRAFFHVPLENRFRRGGSASYVRSRACRSPAPGRCLHCSLPAILAELAPEFGDGKVFRPNRDVRFSTDKSPYKTRIGSIIGASYRDGRLTGRPRRRPSRKVSTFSL